MSETERYMTVIVILWAVGLVALGIIADKVIDMLREIRDELKRRNGP